MNETQGGLTSRAASPKEVLMDEHRVIEHVLDATERMLSQDYVDGGFMKKALDFFRNFADRCHHAKEEDVLFPALERAGIPREGGPIGCMLHEHDQGRLLVRSMATNLNAAGRGDAEAADLVKSAARDYIALLRAHIGKEENVLFVMADHALDEETRASVMAQFECAEQSGGDPGKHARYLALADELSSWKFTSSEH